MVMNGEVFLIDLDCKLCFNLLDCEWKLHHKAFTRIQASTSSYSFNPFFANFCPSLFGPLIPCNLHVLQAFSSNAHTSLIDCLPLRLECLLSPPFLLEWFHSELRLSLSSHSGISRNKFLRLLTYLHFCLCFLHL